MNRALLALLILAAAACSLTPGPSPVPNVRDLAGSWHGRFAARAANATTSLTIEDDGTYAGTMHLEGGDRPFTGAIVMARPGRLRYHGTTGDGTVVLKPSSGPPAALRFVPDGGGGGGVFTRAP